MGGKIEGKLEGRWEGRLDGRLREDQRKEESTLINLALPNADCKTMLKIRICKNKNL